jgi:hypothetical protein
VANDPAEIEKKLNEKADEYVALRRQLAQLASDDPRVTALRKEAVTALDASDVDLARSKLREATDIDRDAVKELAERAKTRALSAADSLTQSARASRIGLHYRDAAKLDFGQKFNGLEIV